MSPPDAGRAPAVLVALGTDHHPFDRLVSWVDRWAGLHPDVDCLVQHGASRAPLCARGIDYLARSEFDAAMRSARVVVCHGGPATIADARKQGHLPLIVPRRAALGEHVDDHQVRFARHVSAHEWGRVVEDESALGALLDRALDEHVPSSARPAALAPVVGAASFAQFVDELMVPASRTTVLYVGGFGRSGSTLIDLLVGQLPGVTSDLELLFQGLDEAMKPRLRCCLDIAAGAVLLASIAAAVIGSIVFLGRLMDLFGWQTTL